MFSGMLIVLILRMQPVRKWMVISLFGVVLIQSHHLYAQDLPPVEVIEEVEAIPEQTEPQQTAYVDEQCQAIIVNQDIEDRYKKIQSALEADYAQGMPKQIKTDLIRVRDDIDSLTVKLFEVDSSNSQEVNHIAQLTIDYLDKMISLLPKANQIAPKVRDRYVVPFTNINSLRAEYQECMMEAAVAQVKDQDTASVSDAEEPSINIYKKLTKEMERLNNNLYTLQTTDVERYVSYRNQVMKNLEAYNKGEKQAVAVTSDLPQVLNKVHREIETLIPGLELSKEYLTVAH